MLTTPSEDVARLLDGIKAFVAAEVVPRHEAHAELFASPRRMFEPDGRFVPTIVELRKEIRLAAAEAGYYTMFVPEELGGAGLDPVTEYWLWEAVFKLCGPKLWLGHTSIAHWVRGPGELFALVDGGLRDEVLPGLLSGEKTMCFCMSEPDAGSDPWMMATRATKVDGGWSISGSKQWITNGPYADYALVFAVTDPEAVRERKGGISAFLLPTDTPGFRVLSVLELFGEGGGDEAILSFDDVRVPATALVGEEGAGLKVAMRNVSKGRLWQSAKAVGLAQWALDQAFEYTKIRSTFGHPLKDYQGVTFPLADSAMEVYGARLMGLEAASIVHSGRRARREVSFAKAYSAESALRAIERSMQTHGGLGFANELGVIDAWREVRRMLIGDGSAEIMRRGIVADILK